MFRRRSCQSSIWITVHRSQNNVWRKLPDSRPHFKIILMIACRRKKLRITACIRQCKNKIKILRKVTCLVSSEGAKSNDRFGRSKNQFGCIGTSTRGETVKDQEWEGSRGGSLPQYSINAFKRTFLHVKPQITWSSIYSWHSSRVPSFLVSISLFSSLLHITLIYFLSFNFK